MFHTFEGFDNIGTTSPPTKSRTTQKAGERREPAGRRVTTLRACTSCRHRKIKCDGEKPCESCRWYKKADLCSYADPRPSRRHVEKLSTSLDEYRGVLEKLFPDRSPDSLLALPRDKLLELTEDATSRSPPPGPAQTTSSVQHPISPATSVETHVSPLSGDDGNLESLQTMPEEASECRESSAGSDLVSGVSDDVNALSLTSKQPSSYLGVSSIHAVLKVIVWLEPACLSYFSRTPPARDDLDPTAYPLSDPASWPRQGMRHTPVTPPQSNMQLTELQLIEAYFTYFQPFVPMLDEQTFRETYRSGSRKDDRWLGLLNIVLALGSIAATTADDSSHYTYYLRARNYLGLDALGSAHLETIQTLGLMGGYYLHYVSQPNLAYSLMGAALRMAATMGLHKEFTGSSDSVARLKMSSVDLKRRIWWSLFCMDTWGCGTLGRPSMGRHGPTISVKLPQCRENENVLNVLPLLENIRFCKIATQVQEALAVAPLVKHPEMSNLDQQLLEWYESLPAILKDHEPCPESIAMARAITRWRYQNQRLLLSRPMLLSYAMRRIPYVALRSEERTAIEKCRALAEETIRDISATGRLNQMYGWHGVWLLFQAVMIPLLGLFLKDNTINDSRASVESCQAQVEQAMLVLARFQPWSPTAKRTLDVVSRIYDASKRGAETSVTEPALNGTQATSSANSFTRTIPPGIPAPPHADLNRVGSNMMQQPGGEFTESSTTIHYMDDSINENMWDYLSWSDNSLWPNLPDSESWMEVMAVFNGEEDNTKLVNGNRGGPAFYDRGMQDGAYYGPQAEISYY